MGKKLIQYRSVIHRGGKHREVVQTFNKIKFQTEVQFLDFIDVLIETYYAIISVYSKLLGIWQRKTGLPENHRAIVFPSEINGLVWRRILGTVSRKEHHDSGSFTKVRSPNFPPRHWRDFSNSIPVNFKRLLC